MKTTCGTILLVFLSLFTSCELFQPKESAENLRDRYLESVTWDTVDQYPLFESCEETADKEQQRSCFEDTLFEVLYDGLSQEQIVVNKNINDTVLLYFTINTEGVLKLTRIDKSTLMQNQIPQLDDLLNESLKKLPKLYAGLKKIETGDVTEMVPVEVSCTLPLIITAF